jgi:hypothetical protein
LPPGSTDGYPRKLKKTVGANSPFAIKEYTPLPEFKAKVNGERKWNRSITLFELKCLRMVEAGNEAGACRAILKSGNTPPEINS